ncbi:MAG: TPM domain-containing protein [Lachnospiraceae bacterium]|nr:TPM domain-containing protein [Lachnospiraceae bacterium]
MRKILISALTIFLGLSMIPSGLFLKSRADEDLQLVYGEYSDETGYFYFVDDEADILVKSEEEALEDVLRPIADKYGNAGVVTIGENYYGDTEDFADAYIDMMFGDDSSVVFVIDMDTRTLTLWSDGEAQRKLQGAGTTITDNVYRYASDGDYYKAAAKAMEQAYTKLDGGRIASPMKVLSNISISVILSLILTYIIAICVSSSFKASAEELLSGIENRYSFEDMDIVFTHKTKEYSPRSSGSGGRGGGGGHSGGGGSHGF